MEFHTEGSEVSIAVNFVDQAGLPAEPTAATVTLYDGDEVEIKALDPLVWVSGETSGVLVIPAIENQLQAGERFEVRIVKVRLQYPTEVVNLRFSYIIEADIQLSIMENTFMNYEYANIVARDFVSVVGWAVSDEGVRKTALVEAFNRITRIPMRWMNVDDNGDLSPAHESHIDAELWSEMSSDDFASFPNHFKRVLRRAQFVEANELLQGDDLAKKRRAGIVQETVGESSTKFKENMVEYGVSSETMIALAGYIHFSTKIGRA